MDHWKGWIVIVGSVVGIGSSVVVWVSGYGSKAVEEGRSMQRLEAVEHVTGELKSDVGNLKTTVSGMQSDMKNIQNGQSRIEAGQTRIEKILIDGRKK